MALKKHSAVLDKLILSAFAAREGKLQIAAKYLSEAADMDGFEDEMDQLDDINQESFDEDFGGDELTAETEDEPVGEMSDEGGEGIFNEGDGDNDELVEDEVSDEEALAKALASIKRNRKLRGVRAEKSSAKGKAKKSVKAEADDSSESVGEEGPEAGEESDDFQLDGAGETEESASANKKRRERLAANLRIIRAKKSQK